MLGWVFVDVAGGGVRCEGSRSPEEESGKWWLGVGCNWPKGNEKINGKSKNLGKICIRVLKLRDETKKMATSFFLLDGGFENLASGNIYIYTHGHQAKFMATPLFLKKKPIKTCLFLCKIITLTHTRSEKWLIYERASGMIILLF